MHAGVGIHAVSPLVRSPRLRSAPRPLCVYRPTYTDLQYQAIELLLDSGASANVPLPPPYSSFNTAPLGFVAFNGRNDLVAMLIRGGADVLYQNQNGDTALHSAARCDFR